MQESCQQAHPELRLQGSLQGNPHSGIDLVCGVACEQDVMSRQLRATQLRAIQLCATHRHHGFPPCPSLLPGQMNVAASPVCRQVMLRA